MIAVENLINHNRYQAFLDKENIRNALTERGDHFSYRGSRQDFGLRHAPPGLVLDGAQEFYP